LNLGNPLFPSANSFTKVVFVPKGCVLYYPAKIFEKMKILIKIVVILNDANNQLFLD